MAAFAIAAHADPAYDTYRRAVLGDSSVPTPPTVVVERLEAIPGSCALYLMHHGTERSEAMRLSKLLGEQMHYEKVLVQVPASSVEAVRSADAARLAK